MVTLGRRLRFYWEHRRALITNATTLAFRRGELVVEAGDELRGRERADEVGGDDAEGGGTVVGFSLAPCAGHHR